MTQHCTHPSGACKEPCHWPACSGDWLKAPCNDPAGRDLNAFKFVGAVIFVGLVCVMLMGGLALKQERKLKPITYSENGCYMWSDGHEQCIKRFTDRVP